MSKARRSLLLSVLLASASQAGAGELGCPTDASAESLERWKWEAARSLTEAEKPSMAALIRRCFAAKVPACIEPISRYSNHLPWTQEDYKRAFPSAGLESMPRELTQGASPGSFLLPPNMLELAKRKGWKKVSGRSRSGGGFTGKGNLVLFQVPGTDGKRDFFIQVDLVAEQSTSNPEIPELESAFQKGKFRSTALVIVDKTKSPPVGTMWFSATGSSEREKKPLPGDLKNCQGCHINPLKTYSPLGYHLTYGDEKKMSAEQAAEVDAMNEAIQSYGPLSWGDYQRPDGQKVSFGRNPEEFPFGWAPEGKNARTPESIRECATRAYAIEVKGTSGYSRQFKLQAPDRIRPEAIARAMNCADCHNAESSLGIVAINENEIARRVLVDHGMPPGNSELTQDERLGLLRCLQGEKYRYSSDWLARVSCLPEQEQTPERAAVREAESLVPNGAAKPSTHPSVTERKAPSDAPGPALMDGGARRSQSADP